MSGDSHRTTTGYLLFEFRPFTALMVPNPPAIRVEREIPGRLVGEAQYDFVFRRPVFEGAAGGGRLQVYTDGVRRFRVRTNGAISRCGKRRAWLASSISAGFGCFRGSGWISCCRSRTCTGRRGSLGRSCRRHIRFSRLPGTASQDWDAGADSQESAPIHISSYWS